MEFFSFPCLIRLIALRALDSFLIRRKPRRMVFFPACSCVRRPRPSAIPGRLRLPRFFCNSCCGSGLALADPVFTSRRPTRHRLDNSRACRRSRATITLCLARKSALYSRPSGCQWPITCYLTTPTGAPGELRYRRAKRWVIAGPGSLDLGDPPRWIQKLLVACRGWKI